MGFLDRKKSFIPTKVEEVRAMRPLVGEDNQYEARMRIKLADGQKLDLIFDTRQMKILGVNTYMVCDMLGIQVNNPIADKAATWWGMGG